MVGRCQRKEQYWRVPGRGRNGLVTERLWATCYWQRFNVDVKKNWRCGEERLLFTASCLWVLLISIIWTLHSGNSNEAHITVYTPKCLIILPPPNTVVPTKHRLTWKHCTFVTNNGHFVNLEILDACKPFASLFVLIRGFDQSQLIWITRKIKLFFLFGW